MESSTPSWRSTSSVEQIDTTIDGRIGAFLDHGVPPVGDVRSRIRRTRHSIRMLPYFQAKTDLHAQEVVQAEVLIRGENVDNPAQNITPAAPDVIMPQRILDIVGDSRVRKQAITAEMIHQTVAWTESFNMVSSHAPFTLWVNVYGSVLTRDFVDHIRKTLEHHDVLPGSVGFELLENDRTPADPEALRELSRDWRLPVALDDVGGDGEPGGDDELSSDWVNGMEAYGRTQKVKVDKRILWERPELLPAFFTNCLFRKKPQDITVEGVEHQGHVDVIRDATARAWKTGRHLAGLSDAALRKVCFKIPVNPEDWQPLAHEVTMQGFGISRPKVGQELILEMIQRRQKGMTWLEKMPKP